MFTIQPHWLRNLLLGLVLFFGCFSCSYAQLFSHSPNELFALGLALFQREQYENAQHYLEAYMQLDGNSLDAVEAQYYAALCAIKLGRPDGEERFHQFVKTYPQHCKAVLAYCQLGNFYFANQDFSKSITYYLQVDESALDKAAQYELRYRLAYAYLNKKDFEQALTYFNDIKVQENAYCCAANYYAGYIAFKKEDYTTALRDFMRASENAAYRPVVPCLVLQIYYKQKRFQKLLNYIHEVRSAEIVLKDEDEIALLTAEAYFFTGNYVSAAQHYEEYIALKDFVAASEVLYRTAYAFYKADEAYKALKYFKELALQEDAIGQSASYYTGLLYLKTNQKMLALAAFDQAQKANFFADIQEEAAFQYARVSYELGHFVTTIEALRRFQQAYATSKHLPEANDLLVEAYLRTNDYDLAIIHIEGLAKKPQRMLKVYQKVTFCKGSEYFNNAAYAQAINLFRKSLNHPFDQALATQAQLWLGESFSALQQYEQAIPVYQHVLENTAPKDAFYQQAVYGLGYAYFNTANYAQALPQFVQYISQHRASIPTAWLQDALVRSADCYYATKNYQRALQCYDQALQHYPAHVHYQKGVIYGILDNKYAAQASFKAIFDDYAHTVYYEKALFEVAHIDFLQNNYQQAIEKFTKFMHQKPHSALLSDALLSRAIAHVNLEQYDQAVQDYERLLKTYPKHPNAQSALLELSKICVLEGKPEKFQQYLTNYQVANSDPDASEKVTFDTAKALFYDQRYKGAIEQLQELVVRYPKSKLVPEATFLVAEAYYRQGDVSSALTQYQAALQEPQTPFYNKILLRIGALAYKQKDFVQALNYYRKLRDCAQSKKESHHALVGMMKASHALQRYETVQQYASQIIEEGNLTANVTSEAILFLGRAAMQQGKHQEAQAYFTQLVKNTQDNHAAEAQYLLAQLYYESQEYRQSLEALFELNERFSAYKAWRNKSFFLIVENYLALKEDLQAKATLRSIIENSEEEAIVTSAKQKLEALRQRAGPPAQLPDTEEESLEVDNELNTSEN
jgi:tetratricopeptide (TPR) repeat protein